MPDYNRRASAYWWTVSMLGALALAWSLTQVVMMPPVLALQVVVGSVITMLAGLFPVRIPGSNNSFAAGEIFIILLLLVLRAGGGGPGRVLRDRCRRMAHLQALDQPHHQPGGFGSCRCF